MLLSTKVQAAPQRLSIFFNKLPWPITRIIKSPAPSDETQQSVSVTYNEESAIEL